MGTSVVRSGVDTWTASGKPNANHANGIRLVVDADNPARSYLFMKNPAPRGATIISATLRITQDDDWTGSHTITARRITESWKAGRITHNNAPSTTATNEVNVTKSGSTAGTVWEFDVTAHIQLHSDGGSHFGWRFTSNNNARRTFYSLQASRRKPTLTVVWSDAPDAPTTLQPDGGVVSGPSPVVRCDYTDVSGSTEMAAIQVQIDAGNDFSAGIDFDSGEVASTEPELDLSTTAYGGLAAGSTTWWRVRVKDSAGLWSDWSESASFTRQTKGTLTITNPAVDPNDFVEEFTPPISWTHTVTTQTAWKVLIADAAKPQTYLYDSGKRLGTDTSHTLPAGVLTNLRTYVVHVRTWDQYAREATVGDTVYVQASREFTVQYDGGVTAPAGLTAVQEGDTPGIRLSWTRGTFPDSWAILRDGTVIEVDLDPGDTFVSGTSHSYVDWGAAPNTPHDYEVRAVVTGATSSGSASASGVEVASAGLWVGNPETGEWFVVTGKDIEWEHGEDAETHTPIGADHVVRIVSGLRGLEGSLRGPMRNRTDFTLDEMRDAFWTMKAQPQQVVRLIASGLNIPVVVGQMSMRPHGDTKPSRPVEDVSLSFWQKGELPFEAEL